MYKVLVAEDEVLTRAGIVATVDWAALNMQLAAQADDGIQALNLFRIHQPDIVITDLNMPRLDGINLIKHIYAEKPACKIIVVTCLNDVQTYKQLSPYNVFDYMLKSTITSQELTEKLLLIKEEIEASGTGQAGFVQEKSENQILWEFLADENHQEFPIAVNKLHLLFLLHTKAVNKALAAKTVQDILSDYYDAYSDIIVAINQSSQFVVCFKNQQLDQEAIIQRTGQFREYVYKALNIKLLCNVEYCENSYELKARCREYFSYVNYARILEFDIFVNQTKYYRNRLECLINLYSFHIFNGEAKEMNDIMLSTPLKKLAAEPVINFIEYRKKTAAGFHDFAAAISLFSEEELNKHIESIYSENTFTGVYLAYKKAVDCKKEILMYPARYNELIQQSLDYITIHCNEKLTLNMVAEHVSLSPNYFSAIFKSTMKINFISYLINFRMDRALELLGRRELYLYEIAEKVGIPDVSHFSKTFKSIIGFSPNEWKKMLFDFTSAAL